MARSGRSLSHGTLVTTSRPQEGRASATWVTLLCLFLAGTNGVATLPSQTQVLIVGGGPTGLATAVELAGRGIDRVIVEPRQTISHSRPWAKTTSIRTMEHFRRWGLAEQVRAAAYLPVAWSQDIVFCNTLLGREVTRFHDSSG